MLEKPVRSLVPSRVVDDPQYLKLRSPRWPSGADLVGWKGRYAPSPGERDKGCSFRRVSVHGDAQRFAKLAGSAPSMQAVVPERTDGRRVAAVAWAGSVRYSPTGKAVLQIQRKYGVAIRSAPRYMAEKRGLCSRYRSILRCGLRLRNETVHALGLRLR